MKRIVLLFSFFIFMAGWTGNALAQNTYTQYVQAANTA
jgi:hypothetical protein